MNNQYANDFCRTVEIYYDDLKKYKPLTKAKEKRLLKQCKKGNIKAQNELLEANLKFVFDIAKHYTGRGVPISDLISEGNMGLIRAINKFDENQDVKFISYAVWWIRQYILDAIKKKKLINIVEIEKSNGTQNVLEKTISDDEDEIVGKNDNFLSNENEEKKKEINQEQKEVINRLLNVLTPKERKIIEKYYGLNETKELTLYEIGTEMNLSSERVRQIKHKSMRKLRSLMLMYKNLEELY